MDDHFEVGDKVLRKNIREEQRKGGKMERELLGPYTIASIEGKSVDLLVANGKAIKRINLDHLKMFVEPQPQIPHKWVLSLTPSASPQSLPSAGPQPDPIPPPTSPQSLLSASPQPNPIPMTPPSAVPQFLSALSVSPEECKY
ncbi:matrix metalloproteinase-9-like [Perca fluviatilis]|uniref:matrix metalloproteinase-9-like n=1 Tax=Perca fluviatilis TaxID=8168 RepID=UPI0019667EAE|nr:matrix metalloproteinase-9-like [Perca fluviatilis]